MPSFVPAERIYLGAVVKVNSKGEHVVRDVTMDSPADVAGLEQLSARGDHPPAGGWGGDPRLPTSVTSFPLLTARRQAGERGGGADGDSSDNQAGETD